MNSKPITHIVRSRDAAGELHFTRHESQAEAEAERRRRRNRLGHVAAHIITAEPIAAPALHRQAVR